MENNYLNLPFNYFIGSWKIDEKLCDEIVAYFYDNQSQHTRGTVGNNELKEHVKSSTDCCFNINDCIFQDYCMVLQECLDDYSNTYPAIKTLEPFSNLVERTNIQRYAPGEGYFAYHCERNGFPKTMSRQLVYMTYLNTVEDAGTHFNYFDVTVPCVKGLTLIWPSDWTHTHAGITNQKENKYITTGWFSYVEQR